MESHAVHRSFYNKAALFVFLLCAFGNLSLGGSTGDDGPPMDAARQSYDEVFLSKSYSPMMKWDVARKASNLSAEQRQALWRLISDLDNEDAWYYALTALVSANDTSSVQEISQQLIEKNNRYHALALGHLGDKTAVPALQEALLQTNRSYVKEDVCMALRMLGVPANVEIPVETTNGIVDIQLSVSPASVSASREFVLGVVITNNTDKQVRITPRELFYARHLAVFSSEGHYVFPIRQFLGIAAQENLFIGISPGESVTVEETCAVHIEDASPGDWPVKTEKIWVLRGATGTWAFDVGPFVPGKDCEIKLVVECDSVVSDVGDKPLGESSAHGGRATSNCAILRIQ